MKYFFSVIFLSLISCSSVSTSEKNDVGKLLESKNYVFIAQTAFPARGSSVSVTGGNYELKMINDSLSVYLPFYGRMNDISGGRTSGPIEFHSKEYSSGLEKKKSRWEVTITPHQNPVRSMVLSVSHNGFADLQVISSNRDNMNYHGTVQALKK